MYMKVDRIGISRDYIEHKCVNDHFFFIQIVASCRQPCQSLSNVVLTTKDIILVLYKYTQPLSIQRQPFKRLLLAPLTRLCSNFAIQRLPSVHLLVFVSQPLFLISCFGRPEFKISGDCENCLWCI